MIEEALSILSRPGLPWGAQSTGRSWEPRSLGAPVGSEGPRTTTSVGLRSQRAAARALSSPHTAGPAVGSPDGASGETSQREPRERSHLPGHPLVPGRLLASPQPWLLPGPGACASAGD